MMRWLEVLRNRHNQDMVQVREVDSGGIKSTWSTPTVDEAQTFKAGELEPVMHEVHSLPPRESPRLQFAFRDRSADFIDDTAWEASIREEERNRVADLIRAHRYDGTLQHSTPDTFYYGTRVAEAIARNPPKES